MHDDKIIAGHFGCVIARVSDDMFFFLSGKEIFHIEVVYYLHHAAMYREFFRHVMLFSCLKNKLWYSRLGKYSRLIIYDVRIERNERFIILLRIVRMLERKIIKLCLIKEEENDFFLFFFGCFSE